jgi:hypothetical protein
MRHDRGEMVFSNKFERRFGWLSFPGFLRYFAMLHAMVYVLTILQPNVGLLLAFDWQRIQAGEVWRVATCLFASAGMGQATPMGMFFMFFMVMIAFMISDALEGAWGVFKTTLFYYCGIIGGIAACFVSPMMSMNVGLFLYESAFFAFATVFPRVEFRLFFVLPVQVRFLAMLGAVGLIWPGFQWPMWWVLLGLGFFNYLLWAGIPALRGKTREVKAIKRRKQFGAGKVKPGEEFHRCAVCSRTEISNPELEFRVGADGHEYCDEHLVER